MPTLRQLEYLVAIDKHRHFGHAAEACHVSQPTLSAQLQTLEDRLGSILVERRRQQVLMTDTGAEVARRARDILEQIEDMRRVVGEGTEPLSGKLVLGVIPTVAPYYLPSLLPYIQKEFPKLKIVLKELQTPDLLTELEDGTVDVGLLALPAGDDVKFKPMPLYKENFVVAAPKGMMDVGAHMDSEKLKDKRLLLLDEGHCLRDQALDVCNWARQQNLSDGVDFRATSLETLKQMVACNLGVTLLPELAVDDYATYSVHPLDDESASRTIGLLWRRTSPKGAEYHQLSAKLKEFSIGNTENL